MITRREFFATLAAALGGLAWKRPVDATKLVLDPKALLAPELSLTDLFQLFEEGRAFSLIVTLPRGGQGSNLYFWIPGQERRMLRDWVPESFDIEVYEREVIDVTRIDSPPGILELLPGPVSSGYTTLVLRRGGTMRVRIEAQMSEAPEFAEVPGLREMGVTDYLSVWLVACKWEVAA